MMWKYFSYPVKLFLKRKIARYKALLSEIGNREQLLTMKCRRRGRTYLTGYFAIEEAFNKFKYETFIQKWDI